MNIKKILTIIGARPQFIKASTLSRVFENHSDFEEVVVHTGQHHDSSMSDIFFNELQIPKPQYHLNIHGGTHGNMTGRMLEVLDEILIEERPDCVLVYGDTNSTLAGALSGSKLHVPVFHIEAGLRSYNKKMPEEINRILTDHVSTLLFCPTKTATLNLAKEGISKGVHHVGDVMYDATLFARNIVKNSVHLCKKFDFLPPHFSLLTIHRQESTQSLDLFKEMIEYATTFYPLKKGKIIFPVHPRTRPLINYLPLSLKENIILVDPVSYFETQFLLTKAQYVLTDSGGLQKEAYFHKVPCITLRSETEWIETIEAGWNQLWKNSQVPAKNKSEILDYGHGNAAENIIQVISEYLSKKNG